MAATTPNPAQSRSPTAASPARRRLGLALALTIPLSACAPLATAPRSTGIDPAPLDAFMQRVERDVQAGIVPGAVLLVARDGQVLYRKAVGRLDPTAATPMPIDGLFRVYSMTKPIVSVAAMQLIEQGQMALGDPVSKYLPELKGLQVGVEKPGADGKPTLVLEPARREMTVQDLMRHTSGLTYGVFGKSLIKDEYLKVNMRPGDDAVDFDNAELVRRVGKLPLAYQPGSTWEYSISTDVLGALVEKVGGQRLDALLQQRILGPLRMRDTSFAPRADQQARVAQPHAVDPDTKAPVKLLDARKTPTLLAGGAGLWSTADDYARFAQMLANGGTLDGARLLSRQSVQWMTSDHTGTVRGPAYSPGPGYGFGLGVAVRLTEGQAVIPGNRGDFHWGGYAGTFWWHDPAERLVAVWMIQGPGRSGFYRPLMRNAVYASLN